MNRNKGWIRIHRRLQDCQIWVDNEPFDRRSAWIDLLMSANHEDKNIIFDYKSVTIKRGQYLTSVRKLGERWSWSKNRVLKYLRLLEALKMITKESDGRRTVITIENYDKFQSQQDSDVDSDMDTDVYADMDSGMDSGMPQTRMNKNEKNEKKENIYKHINIYPSSFEEFWNNYPRKQDKGQAYKCYKARLNDGYSEEQLLTACINYAAECEKDKREKKYIKVASTFLSVNEPFVEYLDERRNEDDRVAGRTREDEDEYYAEIDKYLESDDFKHADEKFTLPFV